MLPNDGLFSYSRAQGIHRSNVPSHVSSVYEEKLFDFAESCAKSRWLSVGHISTCLSSEERTGESFT